MDYQIGSSVVIQVQAGILRATIADNLGPISDVDSAYLVTLPGHLIPALINGSQIISWLN